jgi:hypothetical protein
MVMRARRGSLYIAVLGVSAVVTALSLGAIMAVRVQSAAESALADSIGARYNAEAGVEALAYTLDGNTSWRSRPQGTWMNAMALDRGSFTLDVIDPVDGNFANRPCDPVLVRSRGVHGAATHILEVELKPTGDPIGALVAAVAVAGNVKVESDCTFNLNGAILSSNATLLNNGAVIGKGQALLALGLGTYSHGVSLLSLPKSMPPDTTQALYTGLGTTLPSVTTINRKVLGPGVNTVGGAANDEGIYVLNSSSDVTISASRIYGTLVINAPGRTVTITGPVHIASTRPEYPALIVNANLVLKANKLTPLEESFSGINFNPPGMPFEGVTDSNITGSYPTELRGLVHCLGEVTINENTLIRGALICEATGSNALVAGNAEVVYDTNLVSDPPMGYYTSERLKIKPGTWRQVVAP